MPYHKDRPAESNVTSFSIKSWLMTLSLTAADAGASTYVGTIVTVMLSVHSCIFTHLDTQHKTSDFSKSVQTLSVCAVP